MNTIVKRYGSLVRSAALLAVVLPGCARRFDLTPAELARVEAVDSTAPADQPSTAPADQPSTAPADQPALAPAEPVVGGDAVARQPRPELGQLRIYLSRRLRSYYAQEAVPVEYKVDPRKLSERGAHRPRVRKISRRVPGMVIAEDTQGEMRRLWVTFSKACDRPACAYAFVETELGRYSLVVVPSLDTYKEPRSYRRTRLRRNLLRLSRQRSLAEANEVLAAVRKSKKVLTIDLQVRQDRRRPTRRDGETLRGVGY